MKLCKNCKHFEPAKNLSYEPDKMAFGKCGRTEREYTSPIDGRKIVTQKSYCTVERSGVTADCCGLEAKYFAKAKD